MDRKLLKFNMEIGDPPHDQIKKNEGMLLEGLTRSVI
jgi:hypothetical protein